MEIPIDVKLQRPPNFVLLKGVEGGVPVGSLSRSQAQAYAEALSTQFMEHWERKSEEVLEKAIPLRHGRELGQYDG